jgi:hypothetical protein
MKGDGKIRIVAAVDTPSFGARATRRGALIHGAPSGMSLLALAYRDP